MKVTLSTRIPLFGAGTFNYEKNPVAISKITKIRNEVSDYIECELRKRNIEGLVILHGNILDILYENNGKLTMKEISEGIDRSKSTVTQLVDRLLKAGYVTKESNLKMLTDNCNVSKI